MESESALKNVWIWIRQINSDPCGSRFAMLNIKKIVYNSLRQNLLTYFYKPICFHYKLFTKNLLGFRIRTGMVSLVGTGTGN